MAPAENRYNPATRGPSAPAVLRTVEVNGGLWLGGGAGMSPAEVLDDSTLQPLARMNPEDARRMNLRSGDLVAGRAWERGACAPARRRGRGEHPAGAECARRAP